MLNGVNRSMVLVFLFVATVHQLAVGQSTLSFFPHHVGDVWQYRYTSVGELAWTERLDSLFVDTSGVKFFRYSRLYHDIIPYTQVGWYAIDSVRIFDAQPPPTPVGHWKLLYKLNAQLGEAWLVDSAGPRVAQLTDTGTAQIFGRQVSYIDIQYGYLNDVPDTVWWDLKSLASGFGLIYAEIEPMGPVGLAGAIIDSIVYGFIVNVPEPIEFPSSYVLQQNYPNPFNPTTTIRFSIPHAARVRLEIFDLLGRKVQTLIDEELVGGIHSLAWNASGYASGVYYCRLQTNEIVLTRAMLLEK